MIWSIRQKYLFLPLSTLISIAADISHLGEQLQPQGITQAHMMRHAYIHTRPGQDNRMKSPALKGYLHPRSSPNNS